MNMIRAKYISCVNNNCTMLYKMVSLVVLLSTRQIVFLKLCLPAGYSCVGKDVGTYYLLVLLCMMW